VVYGTMAEVGVTSAFDGLFYVIGDEETRG
jgi:hypothetical protein